VVSTFVGSDAACVDFAGVLVIVGTDHHPFDRVIAWTDSWLDGQPDDQLDGFGQAARGIIQYGSACAPRRAQGRCAIPHPELLELVRQASVVVTHAGPATIMEVRRLGKVPIVVPRNPDLGEIVDGHQMLFAERLAAQQRIVVCRTEAELVYALDRAHRAPQDFRVDPAERAAAERDVADTVARFGSIIDELGSGVRDRLGTRTLQCLRRAAQARLAHHQPG
jgi:UDP-N-acetylglucosamine transferase subunit ALG13